MNAWVEAISMAGLLSTAVVFGTDMFFLMVGRAALGMASTAAGTEVMGFFHLFADRRMPIWGFGAIVLSVLLSLATQGEQRWFYAASLLMLLLFLSVYIAFSKPVNRLQTAAAKGGKLIERARELQAVWDRSLLLRVPLLVVALLAQWLAMLASR